MQKRRRAVSIAVILWSICSGWAFAQPQMEWKTGKKYDFGTVKQKTVVSHIFEFKNIGPDTLKIGQVHTSCGCTAAIVSAKQIAPGGTGTIETKFNTSGRKGAQQKMITVEVNNNRADDVSLTITGDISVPYSTQPDYVVFQNCQIGRVDTTRLIIRNNTINPIKLGKPASSDPHVLALLQQENIAGESQTVLTTIIKPDTLMMKRFTGTINIPLIGAEEQLLSIPVLVSSQRK